MLDYRRKPIEMADAVVLNLGQIEGARPTSSCLLPAVKRFPLAIAARAPLAAVAGLVRAPLLGGPSAAKRRAG